MNVSPHYAKLKLLLTSTYETLLSQSPWRFEDYYANARCSVAEGGLEISLASQVCLNYFQLISEGLEREVRSCLGSYGGAVLPGKWVSLLSSSMPVLGLLPVFRQAWIRSKMPKLGCPELLGHTPALKNRSSERVLGCAPGSKVKWESLVTLESTDCI